MAAKRGGAFASGLRFEQLTDIIAAGAEDTIRSQRGGYRRNGKRGQVVLSYQTPDASKKSGKRQVKLTHTLEEPWEKNISDRRKRERVDAWRRLVLADIRKVRGVESNPSLTVRALAASYVEEREDTGRAVGTGGRGKQRKGITPTSATKMRYDLARFEGMAFYGMQLARVTHSQIQQAVNELCETHSGASVRASYAALNQVFKWALGKRGDNPCDGTALPSLQANPREAVAKGAPEEKALRKSNILTADATREAVASWGEAIRGGARGWKSLTAGMLALTCGLRCEEIAALTWGDVELEAWEDADGTARAACVRVRRAAISFERDGERVSEIGKTKTPSSVRDVPMPAVTADALRALKGRRAEEVHGVTLEASYVVGGEDGTFTTSCALSSAFGRYARRHQITGAAGQAVTLHTLRDTFASRLKADGADLGAVSKLLGHSSIVTTGARYVESDTKALEC